MNSICEEHPDNTLLMVSREITAKGIREKFRHIQANDAAIAQEIEWREAQILEAAKSHLSHEKIYALKVIIKKT